MSRRKEADEVLGAPRCGGTSYLSRPANPLPDAEVHQDPGDGQRYRQRHSNLAWFFQAVGQLMHVAPANQSKQQRDYYPQRERRRPTYLGDACGALKLGLRSQSKSKTINIVLPKLHHCAGEIGSVHNGVVCVTLLCVPRIVARAPR